MKVCVVLVEFSDGGSGSYRKVCTSLEAAEKWIKERNSDVVNWDKLVTVNSFIMRKYDGSWWYKVIIEDVYE